MMKTVELSTNQSQETESSLEYLEKKMWAIVEDYAKQAIPLGERPDILNHTLNTYAMTKAFVGEKMPPEALAATLLHDVVDRFYSKEGPKGPKYYPERAEVARGKLLELFNDPNIDHSVGEYLAHILPDMVHTEEASIKHRQDMAGLSKKNGEADGRYRGITDETVAMIHDRYIGDIPADVWKTVMPLLDFKHMHDFTKDVNIEAMIGKAVELLVNMKVPSSERPSAWLQDILEAESFYAPIVEVLGLEGLAMALRSEAHSIRLRHQGKGDVLNDAKAKVVQIADIGPDKLVYQALGVSMDNCLVSRAVECNDRTGRYPAHIGEFVFQTKDGRASSGNWRLKSAGSLAVKLDKRHGEMPMDMLGMMVISDNLETSARDFADYLENCIMPGAAANAVELKAAPSKTSAIYIQGSPKYKQAVLQEVRARGIHESMIQFDNEETKTDEDPDGDYRKYEVAKITFVMRAKSVDGEDVEIPTEVQFLTKAERKRSRLGAVAHIIYKYISQQERIIGHELDRQERKRIIDGAVPVLKSLFGRSDHMKPNSLGVNERSNERSDEFIQSLCGL